jgi:hypothetical protein
MRNQVDDRCRGVGGPIGIQARIPSAVPLVELSFERVDRAGLAVQEPVDGESLFLLPPLDGGDAAIEVRSNLLPGFQPIRRGRG